jgi:hypothetical protein
MIIRPPFTLSKGAVMSATSSTTTFKQRVHSEIIKAAADYKAVFVDFDYLIYSEDFKNKPYYIISANEDNYPHLTGVNLLLPSAQAFFDKCLDGSLKESDFDFTSKNRSEKDVKGSVRQKIAILPFLKTIFQMKLQAEEHFVKGRVHCSLATSDNALTIGFTSTEQLRPKTLLQSNELNTSNAVFVRLVLRRSRGANKFDTVVQGDVAEFCKAYPGIYSSWTTTV